MNRTVILLDMDGTIADLYSIPQWLLKLKRETHGIFKYCMPLISQEELLYHFPVEMYDIRICSMTPPNASIEYINNVIKEKNEWLDKYFPIITTRYFLPYGNDKSMYCDEFLETILIDDNPIIRENFPYKAIDPFLLWYKNKK